MYGPIESVRLLLEKECAFINYFHIDDAVRAKDDVLTNLGGRIGNCIVRIGFGRAESVASPITTVIETPVVSQPTRALCKWYTRQGEKTMCIKHCEHTHTHRAGQYAFWYLAVCIAAHTLVVWCD